MNETMVLEQSDRVIAKAWADEDFRAALLANPRLALQSQGIEVPEGLTLHVFENSEKVFNLVLPKLPDLAMALVGETLDSSEAGRCGGCGGGCHCGGGGGCGCGGGGCGCGGGGCGCGGGGCNACICICW